VAAERESTWAPMRNKTFRALWLATLASNLGSMIQVVGAGWLMVQLTDSAVMVALVQSSNTLPMMALSLLAGALADSFDKRRLMLLGQGFMLAVSVVLAVTAYAGVLTPWLLLSLTFLIGCGMALYNPSWHTAMADIVGRRDLSAAVSLNSMGFNMMRSFGPAAGGAIVAAAGAALAFAINAASYVGLIVVLWLWRPGGPPRTMPREPLLAALGAGVRYVAMSPVILRVMLRGGLFGLAASSVLALLPLVARDLLGGTALTFGLLLGAFGFGAIAAVLLNAPLRARLGNENVVRLAFVLFAVALAGLSASRTLALSMAVLMLAGTGWVLALSLFNVTVQLSSPRWVVGRAISLYHTATFGGMSLGAWVWGRVAAAQGPETALAIASVLLLAGAASGRWLGIADTRGLDLDPLDRFREPRLRLELRPSSGPILVTVEYRIDANDADAFLALMRARRRIRIRDGARQWALLRDLEHPDLWTESYHVPTWADYIRHNQRRTRADAENADSLRALHRGEVPPRVTRMIERQTVPTHEYLSLKPPPELP
jgi:MFS family permease